MRPVGRKQYILPGILVLLQGAEIWPNPEKMSIKLQYIPSNRKFSALFNGICCQFVSGGEKITRRSLHKKLEFLDNINHCTFFFITRVTSINRNF